MPTFGTPTIAFVLPDDDLVENGTRVARRAGGTRGEARSVRSLPRLAGSLE
jgi:hypothetical protein